MACVAQNEGKYANEIAHILGLPVTTVLYRLRTLSAVGYVTITKTRQHVYFHLVIRDDNTGDKRTINE